MICLLTDITSEDLGCRTRCTCAVYRSLVHGLTQALHRWQTVTKRKTLPHGCYCRSIVLNQREFSVSWLFFSLPLKDKRCKEQISLLITFTSISACTANIVNNLSCITYTYNNNKNTERFRVHYTEYQLIVVVILTEYGMRKILT